MLKSLLSWKHMKTKVAKSLITTTDMSEESVVQQNEGAKVEEKVTLVPCPAVQSVVQQQQQEVEKDLALAPCPTCNRTFLPQSLKKHAPVCERTRQKKRKVFDSSKQRVEGTELAQFHQKTYLKRQESCIKSEIIKIPSEKLLLDNKPKSLTKIDDVNSNLNQINRPPKESNEMSRSTLKKTPLTTSPNQRCSHCGRNFGPKAFDRHVEWCKEHQTRIQKIPTNNPTTLLAKERLEARIKYKVPPLPKTKTTFEKYSTTNLQRTSSIRQSKNSIGHNSKIKNRNEGAKGVKVTKSNPEFSTNCVKFDDLVRRHSLNEMVPLTEMPDENQLENDNIDDFEHSIETIVMKFLRNYQNNPENVTKTVQDFLQTQLNPNINENNRNEESTSSYDPFRLAERQFMELLRSDDFKALTEKTLTRPHTTTSTTTIDKNNDNNNGGGGGGGVKKSTRSAERNPIKRKSVIEPPVNFQNSQSSSSILDNDNEDDFETLENVLNDDNIGKLFQQLNSKINNNDNKIKRKYSDDILSIDSSLINENDNLSIPDHLIINDDDDEDEDDDIYSPTSTECTDTTVINHDEDQDQDPYSIQYDRNIETYYIEKDKKNLEIKRKTMKKSSNNSNSNKTKKTSTTTTTKTKSPITITKLEDEDKDVFNIDQETYEEFKIYEEMYLRGKYINNSNNNNNISNNNNNKKHKLTNLSYGVPLMSNSASSSTATSPQLRNANNDSAYGSLTRTSDGTEQYRIDTSPTSPDRLIGNPKMSKFCHECGSEYPLITAKFCVECGVKRLLLR